MASFLEIQRMFSRAKLLCLMVVLAAPVAGCNRKVAHFDSALANTFFPLTPHAVWSYRVNSKSQRTTYVVTDKALGVEYVPSLNVTGQVVEEYYNMDRGGSRPIVYVTKNGYLTRLSGLEYNKDEISAPAWGRSEEGEFMPALMVPDVSWKSTVFPFGHMEGAFDIKQSHRTIFETKDVVVPAGRFTECVRIDTLANYEGGAFAKSHKDNRLLYQDWYAPHVGLVKTEVRERDASGPQMELVELLRFTPPSSSSSKPVQSTSH